MDEKIRKRKPEEGEEEKEGDIPDAISHHHISSVANHLVLLANTTSNTTAYLLLRATRNKEKNSGFDYLFDDNFRNDDDAQMVVDHDQSTTPAQVSESEIDWQVTPDLEKSVAELYSAYDSYNCTWKVIDFAVFVDESGENWCFKCVFSYPNSSAKKRCVVSNPK